jgi:glutamate N-acetyltransferase/amino-acid N-acetyltransferase
VSVTAPAGFRAAGVAAGIKSSGGPDVAVLINDGPARTAAGVFTRNRVQAAPVQWSRQVLAFGEVGAVILNSGGANACTGQGGFQDAHATAEHAADLLGLGAAQVALCSTGLIGERLPMGALLSGVDAAVDRLSPDGGADAAAAIMTTDTRPKQAQSTVDGWTVGGMAKGAGMLAPSLATMLVVLTTDADLAAADLDAALRTATATTFERVDVDGCLSTNDTVLLLASGASGVHPDIAAFTGALTDVCHDLAQQLVADAEGAQHEIAITVGGAATESDALSVGRAVARDNLVKCAVFGNDPNWGRILAAVGTAPAAYEPDALDVTINGVKVCVGGAAGEDRALVDLSGRRVGIDVDLHAGDAAATIWTTDLTHDYVHENSAYST